MSRLVIKPAASRWARNQFLELPWELYREDPNWIPPLRANHKELAGYGTHPFYQHADVQTFIALNGGEPCGRIAAIVNHAHNQWYNERRGFFGFFESIDEDEVAHALFDAARQWLATYGIHTLRGPTNPSQNYECGLLIDGFDSPPFFMMTYNRPYYARLFENYGFHKAQDLFAFWGHVDMLSSLDKKLSFISQAAAERFQIEVRPLKKPQFREEVKLFLNIYNQSMDGSWGFVPLSTGEIRRISSMLRHLIVPELTIFAEVNGKPVGSVFGILDYNSWIKAIDGRLFPFGFFQLIRNRRKLERIRLISTNVVPEYQRWGVGLVLLSGLVPKILEWGIREAEFSWVMETNSLSRGSLEKGGAKLTKTYRIYDYPNPQQKNSPPPEAETPGKD